MTRFLVMASMLVLAGCASVPEGPPPIPPGVNPEHDSYCRSLMMHPGAFVYTQCRLAMSGTQREHEATGRAALQSQLGPVDAAVESAMRDDVFCNFNEASKLSVEAGDPAVSALTANSRCTTTRTRLYQTVLERAPMQADLAMAAYDRDTIATNAATISEARAFR